MSTFDSISFLLGIVIAAFSLLGLMMFQLYQKRGSSYYMWMAAFFWWLVVMDVIEALFGTLRLHSQENALTAMINLLALPICANTLLAMVTIRKRSKVKIITHFIPFVIAIFPTIFIADDTSYALVVYILSAGYSLVVGGLILYRTNHFNHQLREYYSSIEHRSVNWIYWVLGLLAAMSLIWLVASSETPEYGEVEFFIIELILMLTIVHFLYFQRSSEELSSEDEHVEEIDMPEFFRIIGEKMLQLETDKDFFTNSALTIQDLASYAGTNRTYMSQYLNKIKKTSFYDFINELRIGYACDMLTNTDTPVESVAITAGFGSISVFRRCMRDKYDCTPSEYRQATRSFK